MPIFNFVNLLAAVDFPVISPSQSLRPLTCLPYPDSTCLESTTSPLAFMPGPTPGFLVYSCLPEPPNWAHPTANIATRNSIEVLRNDSIIVLLVSMDVETLRIVLNCTSADVGHSHGH